MEPTVLPLLAQSAEIAMLPDGGIERFSLGLALFAGCVGLLIVVGLPVVLGIRSEMRKREMEHTERMRAIELGRPLPGEGGWSSLGRLALAIGAGVPLGTLGIGWLAAVSTGEAIAFLWPSAGAVGVTAVICGTVLAARMPREAARIGPDPHAKPAFDPDAYDAIAHRG